MAELCSMNFASIKIKSFSWNVEISVSTYRSIEVTKIKNQRIKYNYYQVILKQLKLCRSSTDQIWFSQHEKLCDKGHLKFWEQGAKHVPDLHLQRTPDCWLVRVTWQKSGKSQGTNWLVSLEWMILHYGTKEGNGKGKVVNTLRMAGLTISQKKNVLEIR